MTLKLDRRQLLQAGAFGLGALATPGAAALLAARGFTHNVASGEPGARSVMLWTRYVPATGGNAWLDYQLSPTRDFRRIVAGGTVSTEPEHDGCVKPVAEGLEPGRWYYYRFVDRHGAFSPVGRTRTLPAGPVERFRLGAFTCANLPFGWFNAYAHAADRRDLDLLVHLGDYFYEYRRGEYPSAAQSLAGRLIEPAGEAIALADYRLRYASYRADPDLQRLHQLFPMIAMWDDHESANDSWSGGAENHQPDEGDWAVRKAAAMRAFREWLPVSDHGWNSYEIGDLATLLRVESRLTARSRQLDLGAALRGRRDTDAALAQFRDGPWQDSSRTMLGQEQEAWLAGEFRGSVRQGKTWQLLAQQVVMGSLIFSAESVAMLAADAGEEARRRAALGLAAARAGLPFNLDAWDGYPAARDRLLRSAQEAGANLLVLSGDSHNGWAFDLDRGGRPAGAEMGVHSVTSPGFEAYVGRARPEEVARALLAANHPLKWADTSRRGYLTLELTPERATGTWHFLGTVRARSTALAGSHRMRIQRGTNRFSPPAA